MLLSPQQISDGLTRYSTWDSTMQVRRLKAWTMAR